jgi:hypothetical protein
LSKILFQENNVQLIDTPFLKIYNTAKDCLIEPLSILMLTHLDVLARREWAGGLQSPNCG